MQKVISLFKRDYEGTRLVYDEVVEGAEWVIDGEGLATEKIDGTACMVRDGRLYKRYDAKKGKALPSGFEPAQEESDPVTGHFPGWIPVTDAPEDKWHREGIANTDFYAYGSMAQKETAEGRTFELIGPKVQGNKYGSTKHILRPHGDKILSDVPRDFGGIKKWLEQHSEYEGIVWWHPDGRLVKIKRKDFGLKW